MAKRPTLAPYSPSVARLVLFPEEIPMRQSPREEEREQEAEKDMHEAVALYKQRAATATERQAALLRPAVVARQKETG